MWAEPLGIWNRWGPEHAWFFNYGSKRVGDAAGPSGALSGLWVHGPFSLQCWLCLLSLPVPWSLLGCSCSLHAACCPGPWTPLWCWPPALWVTSGSSLPVSGMSHEPKSPSLGMLSTATRTTATVNPLTPSPLNGALVPSGSPASSSALSAQAAPSSSFAAALRKLAKQAEEPRGKRCPPGPGQGRGRSPCPPARPAGSRKEQGWPGKQLVPTSRSRGQRAPPAGLHTLSSLGFLVQVLSGRGSTV